MNYFNEPFTEDKLRALIKKTGLRPYEVLRKGESMVKELGLGAETPDNELISLIIENPNLLQRPIVEVGEKAVLARPIEKALELIKG